MGNLSDNEKTKELERLTFVLKQYKKTREQDVVKKIQESIGVSSKICEKYLEKNQYNIDRTILEINKKIDLQEIEITGTILGSVETTNINYGMDKFNTPRGHGFAAERANHLADKIIGEKAKIIGDNNAKYGADRLVNGVEIQSKYCKSGSKCISECFKDGQFKYISSDGNPMKIEVPSDKYEDAIKSMENRIKKGQVKGITDPAKAKDIVKKGHFTYEQAKNIAKFGTVESLTYDAVNGVVIAGSAMGVSALITFATYVWSGESIDIALKNAAFAGLKVGGVTFVTSILSSQLTRTGMNSALRGSTDFIVKQMGPKAAAQIANAFRSGPNIYGAAAMNNVSKLLRGNVITGVVTVAVISSVDVVNIFRGRISGAQLFKNVTTTATGVAGGTAGWVGGAAAGASIGSMVPIVGTAVGGVVGGLLGALTGGSIASGATKKVLDCFIEDDAKEMVSIIERQFSNLAIDYLLTEEEVKKIVENLHGKLTGSKLKDMFASSNKRNYANNMLVEIIEPIVKKRKYIVAPKDEEMISTLRGIIEKDLCAD
ncbi:hypothetical protein PN294_14540 [Romboutsia sp. 1001216sp1]|uniref:hypothetical protein n=1 Tax=unclassified Romboutsia TaxID=2626894 RepID=UPI001FAB76BA|nr:MULTISPECIES: hypothetical protein [unclassified Romboutsia]MDB8803398.1 hypothetical protein [Romboutsia sp. 1001216sp1]MDB8814795.1 hypothetical protein [Romboutsia sp. 1001216sp1]